MLSESVTQHPVNIPRGDHVTSPSESSLLEKRLKIDTKPGQVTSHIDGSTSTGHTSY